ncbi:MAG: hypothetical protein KKB70_05110, partial [Proteobacteria bacterium]|nr:hypothetical protein [Pseudomonadota bacterium]MBU1610878.1 hypothetical protein [Pseudomonadota bacterium]
ALLQAGFHIAASVKSNKQHESSMLPNVDLSCRKKCPNDSRTGQESIFDIRLLFDNILDI